MFSHTARYYDNIYSFKDYRAEAQLLTGIIDRYLRSGGKLLLDVACGTGCHLEQLKSRFETQGLDISPELLALARRRNPDVPFHQGDMADFRLQQRFDVITCLFSSIGYVKTLDKLGQAVDCMASHLLPGGLLVVEPWFAPGEWQSGTVHATFVDQPELKIARMNISLAEGRLSYCDFHYLIGTPQGIEHCVERHELGLFETHEMTSAMEAAALEVTYDPDGLTGRGLFIGLSPL